MIRRPFASWVGGLVRLSDAVSFPKIEESADLEDICGVINALFSGLAFSGIIAAIYKQRPELRLQQRAPEREARSRWATARSALAIIRCRSHNTVFHQQAQNFSAGRCLTRRIPMAEPISDLIMQIRTVGCAFE